MKTVTVSGIVAVCGNQTAMLPWCLLALALAGAAAGCDLAPAPGQARAGKAPGDNFYRLVVNGEIERYAPGRRYIGERLQFLFNNLLNYIRSAKEVFRAWLLLHVSNESVPIASLPT